MSHANNPCSVYIEATVLLQALGYVLGQEKFLLVKALQRHGTNWVYIHDCADRQTGR